MKFIAICILLLVASILASCSSTGQVSDDDSLIIYYLPPNNHYLINVTESSIVNMKGVSIIESTDSKAIKNLKKCFISNIHSPQLEEYSEVDARVLLWFKSQNSSQKVLINKFGYFESDETVYDGTESAVKELQEVFPDVLFMKDLK